MTKSFFVIRHVHSALVRNLLSPPNGPFSPSQRHPEFIRCQSDSASSLQRLGSPSGPTRLERAPGHEEENVHSPISRSCRRRAHVRKIRHDWLVLLDAPKDATTNPSYLNLDTFSVILRTCPPVPLVLRSTGMRPKISCSARLHRLPSDHPPQAGCCSCIRHFRLETRLVASGSELQVPRLWRTSQHQLLDPQLHGLAHPLGPLAHHLDRLKFYA